MPRLSNPNSGDLNQTVYDLMQLPATAYMVSGPFELKFLLDSLRQAVPYFEGSESTPGGYAKHPALESIWVAFDGEMGSGVILFPVHPDGDQVLLHVKTYASEIPAIFTQSAVTQGEIEPYPATHIAGTSVVDLRLYL